MMPWMNGAGCPGTIPCSRPWSRKDRPGDFYYSDGFMEGNITGLDKGGEESPELQDGLSQILEGEYDRAVQTLQAFFSDGEDHLMNAYVESVQQWIDDHRDTLDPEPLIWFADRLLQEADQSEIIKFALSLLEFFDLHQEEELAEEIRLLAKCNEFTLFCVRNFLQWKNGQEEIWQTARQVYGWGRIAALEYLDPRTAQIRQWMLEEGWDNDVNPEYTARLLAENVDLLGVLEQPTLTAKAFEGAEALVDALLVDEPVPGIFPDPAAGAKHADGISPALRGTGKRTGRVPGDPPHPPIRPEQACRQRAGNGETGLRQTLAVLCLCPDRPAGHEKRGRL